LVDTLSVGGPEVYEIKHLGLEGFAQGFIELSKYLAVLEANDPLRRTWHYGTQFDPQRYHFVPIHGGWDVIVFPPQAGVIIYLAQSRSTTAATLAGLITVAVRAASAAAKLVTAQSTLVSSFSRGYL